MFWFSVGISAATMDLKLTAPVDPFGVAINWLAVNPVVGLIVIVPVVVTGVDPTVSQVADELTPTEVTPVLDSVPPEKDKPVPIVTFV